MKDIVNYNVFFNSSLSVKDAIGEIIQDEDPSNPLSDQQIVELLAEKGIVVKRRTIVKYRESQKIRRRLVRRDEDLASDYFALLLDSYHDHLTTFRFRVNPAGSYDDSYIDSRGNADFSWDPV